MLLSSHNLPATMPPVPNPRPVKRPSPAVGSRARVPAATRADPTNSDVQA